jgi:hypothetical protein
MDYSVLNASIVVQDYTQRCVCVILHLNLGAPNFESSTQKAEHCKPVSRSIQLKKSTIKLA